MEVTDSRDLGLSKLDNHEIGEKVLTFAGKKHSESLQASRLSSRMPGINRQLITNQAKLESKGSASIKQEKVSPIKLRKVTSSEFKVETKAKTAGSDNPQLWERQQRESSTDLGTDIEFRFAVSSC